MPKYTRILSIDGGGIRGIIPAEILAHLEKILQEKTCTPNARLANYFDLVAGTSTGGILACLMLIRDSVNSRSPEAKYPASKFVELYLDRGDEIFSLPLWHRIRTFGGVCGEKYPNDGLLEVLDDRLGKIMLSELLKPTLITAYDIKRRKAHFFCQHEASNPDRDFRVRDVARATSSAPTYFEVARVKSQSGVAYPLIDGGVYANNPTLCAYAEARVSLCGNPTAKDMVILSLGTGIVKESYSYKKAKDWGLLGWARPTLGIMMSGIAETVSFQLKQIFRAVGTPNQFLRIEPDLACASADIDDASYRNLIELQKVGKATADCHAEELNDFADLLLL